MTCNRSILRLAVTALVAAAAGSAFAEGPGGDEARHLDRAVLGKGCASCHLGHGRPGTPMLTETREDLCLSCHGGLGPGRGAGVEVGTASRLRNLEQAFQKPFRHPIETGVHHDSGEVLPATDPTEPRHVSCLDCHAAHRPLRGQPRDAKRIAPRGSTRARNELEHQLCYRCHGDSANLPHDGRNVRQEFSPSNRSFHPVETQLPGGDSPSLLPPWSNGSRVACSDCHGNDERTGARGPHGSIYPGLLKAQYSTRVDQAESPSAYALCYHCHDRASILAGESFSGHREHLVDPRRQTSCATCHASHGSEDSPHLIRFNAATVQPSRSSGRLEYLQTAPRSGECWLTCHGADHTPGRYCPPGEPCESGTVQGDGTTGQSLQLLPPPLPGWK